MKWMHYAVVLVAVCAGLVLAADVAKAECSVGWTYNVEAKPGELFFAQGKDAMQRIDTTVKAFQSNYTECGLWAESKMEGVKVYFVDHLCAPPGCGPDDQPGEIDLTYFSHPSFSEVPNQTLALLVYASPDAKEGSGVIELYRLTLPGFPSRTVTPVSTVKVHIQKPKPDLCPGIQLQRFDWDFGVVPGGRLNHERAFPTNLTQGFQQMGIQMSYPSQSSLPSSLNFMLDPRNVRGLVIGSVPEEPVNHTLQMKLGDNRGCERGILYMTIRVQPQPDAPLAVVANARAKQVCGKQFSHELAVSWLISGVGESTEIIIEITGPDGKVEKLSTQTLEGTRTFSLVYPGGGSAKIKVIAKDGDSSATAQSSVQLGKCQ